MANMRLLRLFLAATFVAFDVQAFSTMPEANKEAAESNLPAFTLGSTQAFTQGSTVFKLWDYFSGWAACDAT